MNTEQSSRTMVDLERRAAVHAALADVTRLQIADLLSAGDASSSELATALGLPTNLIAHHVKALESAGLVASHRSEGDGRRSYWRLLPEALTGLTPAGLASPQRVLFVCTANTARSRLAAALWSEASAIPAASAGTHPGERVDPGAVAAAKRRDLSLPLAPPRHLDDVEHEGDLVITVCDLAHEELGERDQLHWSIPDPARAGSATAFDAAFDDIAARVATLAPRVAS